MAVEAAGAGATALGDWPGIPEGGPGGPENGTISCADPNRPTLGVEKSKGGWLSPEAAGVVTRPKLSERGDLGVKILLAAPKARGNGRA
jgi:hypothetical protein